MQYSLRMPVTDQSIDTILRTARHKRADLARQVGDRKKIALPLRFWRQQVHYTTPATDARIARKAAEEGFAPARGILQRLGLTASDLAGALDLPSDTVENVLHRGPTAASLVMIDGEDAQAPREDVLAAGRQTAADVFRTAAWPREVLRFYRPSGLDLPWTEEDLAQVLLWAGPGAVDGVVFPKSEHPEQLVWLDEILGSIEQALGVAERSIRVEILVESAWAVRQLDRLALAAGPRLSGIIFGIADYSSDVGLPDVRNDHPTADWVRQEIVNVAGALGVPAIDTMTFAYPVADPSLTGEENRTRVLGRVRTCYEDTLHARALGMSGKWAGHPLQVLAVLLGFATEFDAADVEASLRIIQAYEAAVAGAHGTTILDGTMLDRANTRHAREVVRRAVARGYLAPEHAVSAGAIELDELGR